MVMIVVREERPGDIDAIRIINYRSFMQPQEGSIIDKLRVSCNDLLSLVAERGDELVGHILFSPAVIDAPGVHIRGMGLAPMAVAPEYQRQGVGSSLVKHGLGLLKEQGCPFVIVLGHPEYYPRFGFVRAATYHLKSQWEGVPEEAFMVVVWDDSGMKETGGVARYRDEFDEAM
jgi:putative acetyltransferase